MKTIVRGLVAAVCVAAALAARAQNVNPVGYWSGDGTTRDIVGHSNGLLLGDAGFAPAVVNQGFHFVGGDGRVFAPDVPAFATPTCVTVSCWVRVDAAPSAAQGFAIIATREDGFGDYTWQLGVDQDQFLTFNWSDGPDTGSISSRIPLGRFMLVQAVVNGATGFAHLDVDGAAGIYEHTTILPDAQLYAVGLPGIGIGNVPQAINPDQMPLDGVVDELKVYNVAKMPSTPVRDANGDGHQDLFWVDALSNNVAVWDLVNGAHTGGESYSQGPLKPWSLVSTLDLNGDSYPDEVWQNTQTGEVDYWVIRPGMINQTGVLAAGINPVWHVVTMVDLDGDGFPGIVWQNQATGDVVYWSFFESAVAGTTVMASGLDPAWRLAAVADVNGDGYPDLIWQNSKTGAVAYWLMQGTRHIGGGMIVSAMSPAWRLIGAADLMNNGNADLIWQNTSVNSVDWWQMQGVTHVGGGVISSGTASRWQPVAN
ncbi:MAG: VCBS repeat-containing protein [Armatimonadetes bacterium]|nr:VCBS repeat-containing protein [Armatimonadota bacterium]MDE2205047.1 VCBS repeat-containing protein [Armatimonadota bacterium]